MFLIVNAINQFFLIRSTRFNKLENTDKITSMVTDRSIVKAKNQ